MSTDNEYREVDYAKYCKICKHLDCPRVQIRALSVWIIH